MKKTKVVVVANHKGGTAKTTVVVNLAAELAAEGLSVLLIDLDPQTNLSQHVGMRHPSEVAVTVAELLTGPPEIVVNAVQEDTFCEGVTLIYGSLELDHLNETLRNELPRPSEELRMKLEPMDGLVDVIIIDTPPTLSILTRNGLAAASHVIIPVESGSQYSMYGVNQLTKLINTTRRINPELQLLGALLIKHDERQTVCRALEDVVAEEIERVIPVRISSGTVVRQSAVTKQSVGQLAPHSKLAREFKALGSYVMKELGFSKRRPRQQKKPEVEA